MKKIVFCLFLLISGGSILGQYQLFNKDFEEWVEMPTSGGTVQYLTPYGNIWATSNEAAQMFLAKPSVTRTTDSYQGTYAAQIETIQLGTSKGSGTLFTGKFKLDIIHPLNSTLFGIPMVDRPIFLKGYFKYSPVSGDSCRIASYLTKWDQVKKRKDTIAAASINRSQSITATTVYKEFDIYYHYYSNSAPDSITIIFASSADGSNFNAAVGTTLFIDAVSLEYYPLVVDKLQNQNEILVYPNPAENILTVESKVSFPGREIMIYNSVGSLIFTKQLVSEKEDIPISKLPSGFYYYSISKNDGTFENGKLFKQ
jgi:hypothetical protein